MIRRRNHRGVIDAKALNAAWEAWVRGRLVSVVREDVRPWRHPWSTQVFWDGVGERFFARVQPGFLVPDRSSLSAEVAVSVEASEAPAEALERLDLGSSSGGEVDAYLTEAPMIPIEAGAIFTPSRVPDFFVSQGVGGGTSTTSATLAGGISTTISGFVEDTASQRQLRAVDLILTAKRTRINVQFDRVDDILGLSVRLEVPAVDDLAVLSVGRQVELQDGGSPLLPGLNDSALQLIENTVDDGIETIHIARVYFLSPAGKSASAEVDGSWAPFVEHRVFWNLELREKVSVPEVLPAPIAFSVPPSLGAGTGRTVNQVARSILDDINSRQSEAFALLGGYSVEAVFVTA